MFRGIRLHTIILFGLIIFSRSLTFGQVHKVDSVAYDRVRIYLASLFNLKVTSLDFVLNQAVVLDANPYISTEDCGATFSLRTPTLCDSCGSDELLLGHLTRTNLYCLYSNKSKMCSNISSMDEFNQVASKLYSDLTTAERGLLYIVLSKEYLNSWVINNWNSIPLADGLFDKTFFNDKITARLNESGIRPLMDMKDPYVATFYLKERDEVRKVVLRFSKKGELLRVKEKLLNKKRNK